MSVPPGNIERALLLRLVAPEPPSAAMAPAESADWSLLLDYTAISLSPLVARGLREGRLTGAPAWVAPRLEANLRPLAAAYLQRQSVLRTMCGALAAAEMPAIVLKGAALAHLVYADPTLRPMTDIDLWVPMGRLDEAVAILGRHGVEPPVDLAIRRAAGNPPDRHRTRKLVAADHQVAIELHGRFTSFLGLKWADFDAAWRAGETADLGGVAARVLGPEHQLTHIGLHLARAHAFERSLVNLVDLALVVRRWADRWHWPALLAEWRRERVAGWMLLSLALARDLLSAPVPALETVAPVPAGWDDMRRIAEERLWEARRFRLPPAAGRLARGRTLAERIGFLRRRLFDYYWRAPVTTGLPATLRDGFRRLWYDLRVKLPRYARGLRGGSLRGPALARGIALEQGRGELERLIMAGGDVGYVVPPAEGPH